MAFRSMLFVPGSRPDRFEKALGSVADAVCIDLEDAVAPEQKLEARKAALSFIKGKKSSTALGLRVNALNAVDGFRDVVALVESDTKPDFIMIPKAAGAHEVEQLREILEEGFVEGDVPPFWPLMESPEGMANLQAMALAVGENGLIMFGGADYSASIGSDMSWDALYHARASIVAAAALSGCETMDVPYLNVKDDEGLKAETIRVKSLGFTGRACIHPAQVKIVNSIFTPSTEEISAAERVRSAYEENKGGVALLDGKLIEKPVIRAAERVLACKRD